MTCVYVHSNVVVQVNVHSLLCKSGSKLDLYQLSENVCRAYTSQQLLCSVHSSAAQPASPYRGPPGSRGADARVLFTEE